MEIYRRKAREKRLNCAGFTLIEMLVVVTITVLLSSFLIVYGTGSRQQIALSVEAAKMAQVILRAKSLAVATFNYPVVPCGYGVHIDYLTGSYHIFRYEETISACSNLDPGLLSHSYPPRSIIQSFQVDGNVQFVDDAGQVEDILFIPPNPRVLVWDGAGYITEGVISLVSKNGSSRVDVAVDSSGQVTF